MENPEQSNSGKKIKIEGIEYLMDSLPEKAKQLIAGLRTSDIQTNMYQDTLRLIAISKSKMVDDLKAILKDVKPISNE